MKTPAATAAVLSLPSIVGAFSFRPVGRRPARPTAAANGGLLQLRFDAAASPSLGPTATTAKQHQPSFDDFDYASHWYPVSWACDVPVNQPIRVTLFDVQYVLAKTVQRGEGGEDEEVFYAMLDSCPHKKVALSEGRITDCGTPGKRYFQCSYHGWTFDGESGKCVEIPQTAIAKHAKGDDTEQLSATTKRREDATAVAVRVVQGMVWIHPSYTPLEALVALERGQLQLPPRVPEIDLPGYRTTPAVRDFPIDWTVLSENIMDPDHGYFAHSSSGAAKGFDWYSADGVDNTVEVEEDFGEGTWKITSYVNAVEKLIKHNRDFRSGGDKNKAQKAETEEITPKLATTTFVAPSLITLCRRTNSTSPSPFVTAFWVSPTGVGKSRFMSAAVGKTPVSIPRWLVHMNLNNFLDQDTFLLCGQHRAVLTQEAEGYLQMKEGDKGPNNVRKSTYVYRSPSERLPVRIGQFYDATLARAPNRKAGVLAWYNQNANNHKLFQPWPPREEVLDRYEQHTKICPDSMDVVRRCEKVTKASKLVGLAVIFMKVVVRSVGVPSPVGPIYPLDGPSTLGAIGGFLSQSASLIGSVFNRVTAILLRDKIFYSILALAFAAYSAASRIKREFFFKFNDDLHRKDIKYIAKNWVDL